jgi:antitoxin (DNA-binding transcriptional repressor) of toxin-antitoxin stability system
MTKSITSKELRIAFPKILRQAQRGARFIIYYRSKPILEMTPYEEPKPETPRRQKLTFADAHLFVRHTKDRKPFSAVDLIREDREET